MYTVILKFGFGILCQSIPHRTTEGTLLDGRLQVEDCCGLRRQMEGKSRAGLPSGSRIASPGGLSRIIYDEVDTNCLNMPPILNSWPALVRAAPRPFRQLFTCRQCQTLGLKLKLNATKKALSAYRCHTSLSGLGAIETKPGLNSILPSLSKTKKSGDRGARFPEISDKIVAYWLLGSAASVFGIVVFGGLTRLTESG